MIIHTRIKYSILIIIITSIFFSSPAIFANLKSVEECKQEVRKNPDNALAHYNLGDAYRKSGMYEEAIESYKQVIRIVPDFAKAHIFIGLAYLALDMSKEAIKSFKKAISIDPDSKEAHHNLGAVYGVSGKHQEAIESFKQAIRIDPDDAVVHYSLGLAYLDLKVMNSAFEEYEILDKLDTELASKLFYMMLNAEAIDPDDADVQYNLGITYLQLNDRDSAIDQYKILKKLDTRLANKLFDKINE